MVLREHHLKKGVAIIKDYLDTQGKGMSKNDGIYLTV